MKYIYKGYRLGYIKLLFLMLILRISVVSAVDNLRLADIRSLGMGGNGVTQSALCNPALITMEPGKRVHINYFNRYTMKELGTVHMGFHYPNQVLSAGVDIFSFGYDKYRESKFRLSFGKQLNEKWRLGIGIQYAVLQTELYETSPQQLSADIGAVFSPVDKLFIGMLIMDFPSVSINKETTGSKTFTDYSVQIGFQWEVINNLLIVGSAESNKERTITGSMGMEYTVFDTFRIRAGMQLAPILPSFGAGYSFHHFTVDAAAVYHPVLGISTGLGLTYTF